MGRARCSSQMCDIECVFTPTTTQRNNFFRINVNTARLVSHYWSDWSFNVKSHEHRVVPKSQQPITLRTSSISTVVFYPQTHTHMHVFIPKPFDRKSYAKPFTARPPTEHTSLANIFIKLYMYIVLEFAARAALLRSRAWWLDRGGLLVGGKIIIDGRVCGWPFDGTALVGRNYGIRRTLYVYIWPQRHLLREDLDAMRPNDGEINFLRNVNMWLTNIAIDIEFLSNIFINN